MDIAAIIPARYSSSRFPGKPLAEILGKPMVQRVYEAVAASNLFQRIVVATDHEGVFDCVVSFGGHAAMTRTDHASGTDRVWEVVSELPVDAVVNVQGDEPLIDKNLLQAICFQLNHKEPVVSAAFFSENREWFDSADHVKVVFDTQGYALYFSRSGIPFHREQKTFSFWHHIGIYGYQKSVLKRFVQQGPSHLEDVEKLEQLRLLENGFKIKLVQTDYQGLGVDRPGDIALIEKIIESQGSDC